MVRKAISIILIASIILQISCATTKRLPVASNDYDKLKEEKGIFVTMRSGQEYELIDFKITDTHIIGTSIIRYSYPPYKVTREKIEIKLEDIELIHVKENETNKGVYVFCVSIGILGVYLLYYLLHLRSIRG